MSSRNDVFECQWRPSRWLLSAYAVVQVTVLGCLLQLDVAGWALFALVLFCIAHACWVIPRHVRLTSSAAYRGLRCNATGWQVYSQACGWQAIEFHPDSLALPLMVFLRFRLVGQPRVRALCVARDCLPRQLHRQLRLRLKFSRHRWAVAG